MNPNIRIFEATATEWSTQGLGVINPSSCTVTEELNGLYELEMGVPITDRHYADLAVQRIIVCKPNPYEDPEPFRIYQISKPIGGIVTVNAAHISYDLSKYADVPFTAANLTQALAKLKSEATETCPFTFQTDKTSTNAFNVRTPSSIRGLLGGSEGSILDIYGGEWKFTGYTCYLYTHRGQDRGATIRYGKNMTDLKQEENCAKVYSKLYPYWADMDGNIVEITGKTLDINQNGNGTLVYDMSSYFSEKPTPAELETVAQQYIDSTNLSAPIVNLSVKFVQSNLAREIIFLGDTLKVEFLKLRVSSTAKIIRTVYNALLDRYDDLDVGDVRRTFAQTITELQDNSITGEAGKAAMRTAIDRATSMITGNNGGYIVLHDRDENGEPDELLVMDQPSILTAQNVWRWNYDGLGFSSTGYNGPYGTAITSDGAIVADYISSGTLDADIIKAGILEDAAGINSWNMETGEFNVQVSGTVESIETYYAESEQNTPPRWDLSEELLTYAGDEITDYSGNVLLVIPAWTTTVPTTASPNYRWMRNLVTYKDGTTELTSASPMQDYYGRANLVIKAGTDGSGNPIGILSGLADYMRFDAGQLEVNSPQFTLDREGNARFAGEVVATSLTLGSGVNIDVDRVSGFNDAATAVINGTVTANYVNALGITAASVAAENITGTRITGKTFVGGRIQDATNQNYWDLNTGEITITSFVNQFNALQSSITSTQSEIDALEVGIAVDNNGVTVGRQNAAVKGVFGNDSLEFQNLSGTPLAWLSANSADGLGVDLIQIGSHDTVTQRWIVRTDSNGDRLTFSRRAS